MTFVTDITMQYIAKAWNVINETYKQEETVKYH